jgi:hypothetical protein
VGRKNKPILQITNKQQHTEKNKIQGKTKEREQQKQQRK